MIFFQLQVYENFLEEIDGVDNGVPAYEGVAKYKVTTTLSSRVGCLRPSWLSKDQVKVFHENIDLLWWLFKHDKTLNYS